MDISPGNLPSVLDITGSAELKTKMDTQFPMIYVGITKNIGQSDSGITHAVRALTFWELPAHPTHLALPHRTLLTS